MGNNVRDWVKRVHEWLTTQNRTTFYYKDLPAELQDDSYFRRAARRGYLLKCGKSSIGYVTEWRPAERLGKCR